MAIQIYDFSSGLGTEGIQGYTNDDRLYYVHLNRPLKRLVENDQSIISQLDESILTNRLDVSSIAARTGSFLYFKDNVKIEGNISVLGSQFTVHASDVAVQDNIIIINHEGDLGTDGVGGIELDRGTESAATILYHEDDGYWHFSYSGIKAKSASVESLYASVVRVGFIDFSSISDPGLPVTDIHRIYVDDNEQFSHRWYTSEITNVAGEQGRYEIYISNQQDWFEYCGNSELTGNSSTVRGWNYSQTNNKVTVQIPENTKIIMEDGEYNWSTYLELSNGVIMHGKNKNNCKLKAVYDSVGIGNLSSSWLENIDFDGFTIDGDNVVIASSSLININKVRHSVFKEKVINANVNSIYDGNGNNLNIEIGDAAFNTATVIKGLTFGKVKGYYESNVKTITDSESVILNAYIDDSPYLGVGNWDL